VKCLAQKERDRVRWTSGPALFPHELLREVGVLNAVGWQSKEASCAWTDARIKLDGGLLSPLEAGHAGSNALASTHVALPHGFRHPVISKIKPTLQM
jgi:hypothetical protein